MVIRTLTNQKYDLEVSGNVTIAALKDLIHSQYQLGELETQKLIFSGKILQDNQTLDEAKIKDGGFIVLMIKKESVGSKKPAAEAKADAVHVAVASPPVSESLPVVSPPPLDAAAASPAAAAALAAAAAPAAPAAVVSPAVAGAAKSQRLSPHAA